MANNNTIKAGVIGWPVSHSLSPRLHGFWLKKYGIDGTYDPIAVEPEKLESRLKSLSEQGFAGTNVTVPHKEAALRAVDEIDDHARRIGVEWVICIRPLASTQDITDIKKPGKRISTIARNLS